MDAQLLELVTIIAATAGAVFGVDRGANHLIRLRRGRNGSQPISLNEYDQRVGDAKVMQDLVTKEHCREEHERLNKDANKREKWEEDVSKQLASISTNVAVLVALNEHKRNNKDI